MAYLLNLETLEKIEVPEQSFSSFLTDELWFIEAGVEDFIFDRTTEQKYPINIFRILSSVGLVL
jgi:hypothetical protein